jgi:hypothetical protein
MELNKFVKQSLVIAVAFLGVVTTQAVAVNLTGTWEGEAKCTGFFNGAKIKDTFSGIMGITQTGTDLNMDFLGLYNGFIIDDAAKPDKQGQGSFIFCSTVAEPLEGLNEIGHITLAKTNGDKGTFKATSVFTFADTTVETCKWNFKRIDTADPGVLPCPN